MRQPGGFDFSVHARTGKAFVPFVRRGLLQAHHILRPPLRELSIALVGQTRMAELHEQYLAIAGPTDVLTFELDHDARGRVTAGEVVVCVPVALKQARRRGIEPRREVLLYALHGMLHLCGFDDRTDRGFQQMHAQEDAILTRLGVGPVFRTSTDNDHRRRPRAPGIRRAHRGRPRGAR